MYIPVPRNGELSLDPVGSSQSASVPHGSTWRTGEEHICLCVYVEVGPGVFTCTHAGGSRELAWDVFLYCSPHFFETGSLNLYLATEDKLTG